MTKIVPLPRNYTLPDLLRIDPMGQINNAHADAYSKYNESDKEGREYFTKLCKLAETLVLENPQLASHLTQHVIKTSDGRAEWAKFVDMSDAELKCADEYQEGLLRHVGSAPNSDRLVHSWRQLKKRAGIADIDVTNFPTTFVRPMLVLYSADWCEPCKIMRPTFARLVRFYDKAEVRYCHDNMLQKNQNVAFIPQFVAYFPCGAVIRSRVGHTTEKLWDTMNNLVLIGKSWEGTGELICTDEKCEMVRTPSAVSHIIN